MLAADRRHGVALGRPVLTRRSPQVDAALQLDGTVSPLRVLSRIVKACPEVPVMADSGFRRGTDVLKALALGAKFVFVGRPFNYAAAVAGGTGVRKGISLLRDEVSRDMAMLGVTSPSTMRGDFLVDGQARGGDSITR